MHEETESTNVGDALHACRDAFIGVGLAGAFLNLLALTGSLYMLQVYDRVIPSKNLATLVGLSIMAVGLYAALGIFDWLRGRLLTRIGARIDRLLRRRVMRVVLWIPLRAPGVGEPLQPIRDLDQIRGFISSSAPTALFDLPWIPFYLAIVFAMHPLLGLVAVGGACIIVLLTWLAEARGREPARAAGAASARRLQHADAARRNAEVIAAMGMGRRFADQWGHASGSYIAQLAAASDTTGGLGSLSKVTRYVLQSAILGTGAFLVVKQDASAGIIIAASVIVSRALAPIEIAIANWHSFISARQSYARLNALLKAAPVGDASLPLRAPATTLHVEDLAVAAPAAPGTLVLSQVSFKLQAGAGLGIVGPSGSGKSTLARAIVGVWPAARGAVRLDGAMLQQWEEECLGKSIGYLPQDVELFDGTIAQNIARFDPEATPEDVLKAASDAGVHDMIVNLPEGYNTRLGEGGASMSGGHRQRIALARALYGEPFLIVLDEPNSNLDTMGDAALTEAIRICRQRGAIVVVVAHRPSALAGLDQVLLLADGQPKAFGPKDDILRSGLGGPRRAPVGLHDPGLQERYRQEFMAREAARSRETAGAEAGDAAPPQHRAARAGAA
jgi:ATP-binding cassette subfamily C protein